MLKDLIVCDQNNTKQFYMLSVVFIHKKMTKEIIVVTEAELKKLSKRFNKK